MYNRGIIHHNVRKQSIIHYNVRKQYIMCFTSKLCIIKQQQKKENEKCTKYEKSMIFRLNEVE